jgi:two-component system sporulation sensor kinase A
MASVLAHEVGNPLNAIHLQIQILRRLIDRPERGPLVPKIDSILSEITRLNSLLEDFRAYRDSGAVLLTRVDLRTIIGHVLELLAGRAAERDVQIRYDVEPTLPHVLGNGHKLQQVFTNLCRNAIEAMPDGGKLHVCARAGDQLVHVDVTDEGCGLPADLDVFAPFTTTKPSGMGLGLPLAREIVGAHGGTIRCASPPTGGTTFTVSLPTGS